MANIIINKSTDDVVIEYLNNDNGYIILVNFNTYEKYEKFINNTIAQKLFDSPCDIYIYNGKEYQKLINFKVLMSGNDSTVIHYEYDRHISKEEVRKIKIDDIIDI